jgi:hypothetical protein
MGLAAGAFIMVARVRTLAHSRTQNHIIVHEWGTLTSVIDETGAAMAWRPLSAPSDLPGFIYGIGADGRRPGARNNPQLKLDLTAKIRMETPVVYFYTDRETSASLRVEFPQGYVTEWYPAGAKTGRGIGWEGFKILPGATASLPVESGPSRYYAARSTDSAPLRISGPNGVEDEKFLFYRGIGNFELPLSVKLRPGRLMVKASSDSPVAEAIFFENRSGREGYQIRSLAADRTAFYPDAALQPTASLRAELVRILVGSGLYESEAQAMLDTWGDSWSEPGGRIFYILPRRTTDSLLPLTIDPQPTELERVIVCRTEIITPGMEQAVLEQLGNLGSDSVVARATAEEKLRQHGRFLGPVLERLLIKAGNSETRARIDDIIKRLYSSPSESGRIFD